MVHVPSAARGNDGRERPHHKRAIVSLVERGGQAPPSMPRTRPSRRSPRSSAKNVAKESRLHTDTSALYKKVGQEFEAHEKVNHFEKEFSRGDVTTNTIEGF